MAQSPISRAIEVLLCGGIIAHQTDTVIGFASLPTPSSLQRLQRIKHRQNKQGFILLASTTEQVLGLCNCTAEEEQKLREKQVRPTTWIINANSATPALLKSERNQIAIRVTKHSNIAPITQVTGPIVSTSANLTNVKTCLTVNEVRRQFGSQIDFIVKSDSRVEQSPSMIIDIHSNKILRA